MNTKFIKISFLICFFLQSSAIMAQRNIFRPGNVTITTSTAMAFGNVSDFIDENPNTISYFSKPVSNEVEVTMELLQPEKITDYIVNIFSATSFSVKEFILSGSDNGTVWTVLNNTANPAITQFITVSNTKSYKYYKLTFRNFNSTLLVIGEISAYDSGSFFAPVITTTPGTTGNTATISWTKEILGTGSYEIERSTNRVDFKLIKTVSESVLSFTEDTLKRNTAYWYRMRSKKGDVYSPYSGIKELITANDLLINKPTFNVTPSTTISSTASLTWALIIGGPGTFELERSLNGTDFTLLKTFDKAVVSYTDTTLVHNTSYWYRIRGKNDISTSPYSNTIKITTINDLLLNAPTLSVLSPTGTQAILSWALPFNSKGGFELERSTDGINFIALTRFDKAITTYINESLSPNTDYWYRIRAFNYLSPSPYSPVVKITTNSLTAYPLDITNDGGALSVSIEYIGGPNTDSSSKSLIDNSPKIFMIFSSQTTGNLSATYQPTGIYLVTGYALTTAGDSPNRDPKNWRFEGSDDQVNWTVLDTRTNQLGSTVARSTKVNYYISGNVNQSFKYYRIAFTANNSSTDGIRYQLAEWEIFGVDTNSPKIPANFSVTSTTVNTVSLSWSQDPVKPASKYVLQRSEDGISFNLLDTLSAPLTSYTDKGLYDGYTYYYRINALGTKRSEVSGWSNVISGKTLADAGVPLSPKDLASKAIQDTLVSLKWIDRSDNETGFALERSRDNVLFEVIQNLAANTTAYTDDTVWPGTVFYYRIAALKDKIKSAYSNVLKITTTGINTPPLATSPIIPRNICTGSGIHRIAFNGIVAGPSFERIQKMRVTSVKAKDNVSNKFFSSYWFKEEVNEGIVNYGFTTTGIAVPGDSATIVVTVKDDGGTLRFAPDSTEFMVKIYFTPLTIKITADREVKGLPRYSLVNLTAVSNFPENTTYEWTAANGIEGARNGIKLMVRPTQTVTYVVKAITSTGCAASANITLSPQDSLVVANVLTPNRDGKNDTWIVWGIEKTPNSEVKVFNRQGRLVFARKNYNNDWDGTYNGATLPQGGYYYIIDMHDGNKPQSGVLMIIK